MLSEEDCSCRLLQTIHFRTLICLEPGLLLLHYGTIVYLTCSRLHRRVSQSPRPYFVGTEGHAHQCRWLSGSIRHRLPFLEAERICNCAASPPLTLTPSERLVPHLLATTIELNRIDAFSGTADAVRPITGSYVLWSHRQSFP
jgi:hypothetical protein